MPGCGKLSAWSGRETKEHNSNCSSLRAQHVVVSSKRLAFLHVINASRFCLHPKLTTSRPCVKSHGSSRQLVKSQGVQPAISCLKGSSRQVLHSLRMQFIMPRKETAAVRARGHGILESAVKPASLESLRETCQVRRGGIPLVPRQQQHFSGSGKPALIIRFSVG